jgi:hypothetical protein
MTRSILTKIYTVANVVPGLEKAWLQHLRDFDAANTGCHFEVIADTPNATLPEIIEMLRVKPSLSVLQVMEHYKGKGFGGADLAKTIVALLPDNKAEGLMILDAARRLVETFKR